MNKRKLWCFMQAFSYPLSVMGILALIFLGLVTKTPEITIIPAVLIISFVTALIIVFLIGSTFVGLLECWEDYRFKTKDKED